MTALLISSLQVLPFLAIHLFVEISKEIVNISRATSKLQFWTRQAVQNMEVRWKLSEFLQHSFNLELLVQSWRSGAISIALSKRSDHLCPIYIMFYCKNRYNLSYTRHLQDLVKTWLAWLLEFCIESNMCHVSHMNLRNVHTHLYLIEKITFIYNKGRE